MTSFDILFLAALLATICTVLRVVYLLLRGRRNECRSPIRRWMMCAGLYALALLATSALQPRTVVAVGQQRCFDDWCVAVDSSARQKVIGSAHARGTYVIVRGRILNRGRGRTQRERDVYAVLRDDRGNQYREAAEGEDALTRVTGDSSHLTDAIDAGASKRVSLVFDVPGDQPSLVFIVAHAWFPHALIIGDSESLFHRPTVVLLADHDGQ